MMDLSIDHNMVRESEALNTLFNEITNGMKTGIPNFEELVCRAGKLHSSLKNTISVLSSFLDSFQKIADDASNNRGGTKDIGTCLTRIVIRHRALESRMKTLAGALMDCLIFPIQAKSEEWKKGLHTLEKEHIKGNKKSRLQIKKKSDQVLKLKKKLKKENGIPDPALRRLLEQALRDLNVTSTNFEKSKRSFVSKALIQNRNCFNTFVAFLKPVLDEEVALFGEIHQIEDVLSKLNGINTQNDTLDSYIKELLKNTNQNSQDHYRLYLPTPPSSPLSSIGSRNDSITSIDSASTISYSGCTNVKKLSGEMPFEKRNGDLNRPWSTAFWDFNNESQPFMTRSDLMLNHLEHEAYSGESENESTYSDESQNFSTIKRSYGPMCRALDTGPFVKRVSIAQRSSSVDRTISPIYLNKTFIPCISSNICHGNSSGDSGPHYAIPKSSIEPQHVPNFHNSKMDMVIPHPIYLNTKQMENMKRYDQKSDVTANATNNMLKKNEIMSERPEQGYSNSAEDGSSLSSDSIGSSSGYGSQFAIKLEDNAQNQLKKGLKTNLTFQSRNYPSHNFNRYSTISDDRLYVSNLMNLQRRSLNLKSSHSIMKGPINPSISKKAKPVPPIRASSILSKQSVERSEDCQFENTLDEDITPRGSLENLSATKSHQELLGKKREE